MTLKKTTHLTAILLSPKTPKVQRGKDDEKETSTTYFQQKLLAMSTLCCYQV
jgi:hypothetical protein